MRRSLILLVLCFVAACSVVVLPGSARAESRPPIVHGLLITPIRIYPVQAAGSTSHGSFTVANLTASPLAVNLSVKQFSVSDYSYTYQFDPPDNNWVAVGEDSVTLKPNESQDIPYSITIPPGTAGGGHYYTFFASATLQTGGLSSTVQATTLAYLTVQGTLRRTSTLQSSSAPYIVFSRQIPYTIVPRNTGNIHYFIYTYAKLKGLFVHTAPPADSHLLLPSSSRVLTGYVAAPPLPGVFHLTYGYHTESGTTVTRSGYVVYLPPWFIALVLASLVLLRLGVQRRRTKKHKTSQPTTP